MDDERRYSTWNGETFVPIRFTAKDILANLNVQLPQGHHWEKRNEYDDWVHWAARNGGGFTSEFQEERSHYDYYILVRD